MSPVCAEELRSDTGLADPVSLACHYTGGSAKAVRTRSSSIKYYNDTANQAKCSGAKHHAAGGGLAVMSREVGQSGDRWLASDGGVGSVMIVEVQPAR